MSAITSFAALADKSAQILILGSMPSLTSLKAQQYYAHPRNSFWPIMASLYAFDANLKYDFKVQNLMMHQVAVWDVLQSCIRHGSLDSAIVNGSRVANDVGLFLQQHPNIKLVCFNGAEAETSFKRFVLTQIDVKNLKLTRLPSTSPANTQSFAQKQAAWAAALTFLE
ncbi:MAG: DNA-deoxyinosine glycosylase [Bdellovibrio sp.]|nr:DNA-deoxyinosine glycosylase [Methylotenera sp.]